MKLSYGGRGKPKLDGTIFMGGVYPLRHHVKILIWQLEEGLSWMNGLKMRKEKFIFDEIIPAPYTF